MEGNENSVSKLARIALGDVDDDRTALALEEGRDERRAEWSNGMKRTVNSLIENGRYLRQWARGAGMKSLVKGFNKTIGILDHNVKNFYAYPDSPMAKIPTSISRDVLKGKFDPHRILDVVDEFRRDFYDAQRKSKNHWRAERMFRKIDKWLGNFPQDFTSAYKDKKIVDSLERDYPEFAKKSQQPQQQQPQQPQPQPQPQQPQPQPQPQRPQRFKTDPGKYDAVPKAKSKSKLRPKPTPQRQQVDFGGKRKDDWKNY